MEEKNEEQITVSLVIYKGDERIVIGEARVDPSTFEVTAEITDPVQDPIIRERLKAERTEFSFGFTLADKAVYPLRDMYNPLYIRPLEPHNEFRSIKPLSPKPDFRELMEQRELESPFDTSVSLPIFRAIRDWYQEHPAIKLRDIVTKEERDGAQD